MFDYEDMLDEEVNPEAFTGNNNGNPRGDPGNANADLRNNRAISGNNNGNPRGDPRNINEDPNDDPENVPQNDQFEDEEQNLKQAMLLLTRAFHKKFYKKSGYILQEMLTYKSDHIRARQEVLGSIIFGETIPTPEDAPESFRLLVRELRSLALELNHFLVSETTSQINRKEA
ncbi:hypothetical protein L6452_18497 [Arctium lappa]|uniref:Uncharacterized protein n=1 Tax=Arctium lappa TaxID=4217 RepID=A0ACB9C682_ARCLA|nr:hypothetical protein L6452_18497 [Arctium lappa]